MASEDIRGEEAAIREISDFLIASLDEYLKEHTSRQIDVFMAVHNFHRFIVSDMAQKWQPGIPVNKTYQMADLTFRNAMRDLRRSS